MKVVMVGAGNVATILGRLIHASGHKIVQVVSRNIDHAISLASKFSVNGVTLTEPHFADADIYIIALHDAALGAVEKIPGLKDKFVVHTAGSVSKDVLSNISNTYGVLYPLQTLSKSTAPIPHIPFLIEGNATETLEMIRDFAGTLSGEVISVNEQQRLHYHVAAVFAGNFTNHLYALAENFCEKEEINFKHLLPLINEVTFRVNGNSPRDVQTGPAIREDIITLNRHLETLSPFPDLKYIYLKLSESILKLYEKK